MERVLKKELTPEALLTTDQKDHLSEILRNLELNVEAGKEQESLQVADKLKDYFMSDNIRPSYTYPLLIWVKDQVHQALQRGAIRKKINDFYSSEEPLDLVIVGKPTTPEIRAYDLCNNKISVYNFAWPNLQIVSRQGIVDVTNAGPIIQEIEIQEQLNSRRVADYVLESLERPTALMRSPKEMPAPIKALALTTAYIPRFHAYVNRDSVPDESSGDRK